MIRSQKLFPAVLIGSMASLMIWLDQISQFSSTKNELNPAKPLFMAEDIKVTRFSTEGNRQEQLVAKRAWQFPKRPNLYLDNFVLTLFDPQEANYTLAAETGYYNPETKLGFFDQKVTMQQPASPGQPATTVLTSAMHLDILHQTAKSAAPVTFYHANSVATGIGFQYNYRTRQLNILSNASIRYEQ